MCAGRRKKRELTVYAIQMREGEKRPAHSTYHDPEKKKRRRGQLCVYGAEDKTRGKGEDEGSPPKGGGGEKSDIIHFIFVLSDRGGLMHSVITSGKGGRREGKKEHYLFTYLSTIVNGVGEMLFTSKNH